MMLLSPGEMMREERRDRLRAIDRMRGLRAFRVAVRVAVVRWKNSASKRRLRDKLARRAEQKMKAFHVRVCVRACAQTILHSVVLFTLVLL